MLRKAALAFVLAAIAALVFACARVKTRAPLGAEPSPIALEAAAGSKFVKAGASQQLVARIDLSTPKRRAATRPPVNVALLIDTSGSMEGRAIDDARAASLALVSSLAPDDRLAVVVFHSKAEVLLPSTRIDDADTKDLRARISAMKAQGTTDMSAGLRLALDEVSAHLVKEGVNRVVLVGDGVPNDDQPIPAHVGEAIAKGISITTLGLGNDYDETLMGRIAQQTGGRFSYVEDSNKVASFFKEEVVRLHRVVARNAVLELRPGPGVVVQGVVGRPSQPIARGVSVVLGDVTLGEKQELVVELVANGAKDGATIEALDAVLHYQDGVGGETHEDRVFLGVKATMDDARIASGRDESVTNAAARAKDAAATLMKIEEQRNIQNAVQRSAPRAAMPSPSPSPSPSPAPASPVEQRQQHNEAMKKFQAY